MNHFVPYGSQERPCCCVCAVQLVLPHDRAFLALAPHLMECPPCKCICLIINIHGEFKSITQAFDGKKVLFDIDIVYL